MAAQTHLPAHLDDDLLNAWLDGEATGTEADAIRDHLAVCERCQAELESLRAIKTMLADLPEARLPRSFTLTPAQAARKPEPVRNAGVVRLLPVTRILGIAAVIAFLVLGAADAFGPITESLGGSDNAPANAALSGTNPDTGASQEQEQAPMRAAAPGQVIDRGTSATSSNDVVGSMSQPAPVADDSDTPALRVAWIASGALAVVALAAWAFLGLFASPGRSRSS